MANNCFPKGPIKLINKYLLCQEIFIILLLIKILMTCTVVKGLGINTYWWNAAFYGDWALTLLLYIGTCT